MNLIDLYVQEVGQHLPVKNRADIQKEIRSMIEDMLEDRSQSQGKPVDDQMMVDLLKGLGAPDHLAASYLPPRYLIGPRLYPAFITTLRIALTVIGILSMVGLGFTLSLSVQAPVEVGQAIANVLSGMVSAIISAVGVIAIVFAILERTVTDFKTQKVDWDPRKMKAVADPEIVSIREPVAEIIFTILALLVFNLYPQWVGIVSNTNGHWVFTPVMAPAFFQTYLPWLNVLWLCEAAFNILLLGLRRRTAVTRWIQIGLKAAGILLGAFILTGPAVLAMEAGAFGSSVPAFPKGSLADLMNNAVRVAVAVVIVVNMIEIGQNLYEIVRKRVPIEQFVS